MNVRSFLTNGLDKAKFNMTLAFTLRFNWYRTERNHSRTFLKTLFAFFPFPGRATQRWSSDWLLLVFFYVKGHGNVRNISIKFRTNRIYMQDLIIIYDLAFFLCITIWKFHNATYAAKSKVVIMLIYVC